MWYVLHAEKDSDIIVGFNKPMTADEYQFHLDNHTLMSIMNTEKAAPGDVFFLPPGRIHAIGKGILLAEIQQTSDATLRIYDFDRLDDKGKPRELHTEQALKTIDFSPVKEFRTPYAVDPGIPVNLATCPYFTTNLMHLSSPLERNYHALDSFVVYICVQGKATLTYRENGRETLEQGETMLLPAEIKKVTLNAEPEARILEVYIEGSGERNFDELIDRLL
jgi:mannose-6-phosphate isomerase